MKTIDIKNEVVKRFGSYSLFIGILLTILGAVGIVLPELMSLATEVLLAWLLLVGGLFWAMHTFKFNRRSVMDWLKPVLLIVSGILMVFYPVSGVASVGLLMAIYLLMDSFSSFVLAQSLHPAKGWGWMAFNGVMSAVLAGLFLIGWPSTSLWLVGLYVGISLFFDGTALIFIGWMIKKQDQLEK